MSSKSKIVSEKDFYKIKSGTTLFSPKLDQFGEIGINEFFFEGKRVKAEPDSIWVYGYCTLVFPFKKKGKWNIDVPGRYPEYSILFWTRRAALSYAQDVKDSVRSPEKVSWVRRVRKQTVVQS